MKNISAVLFMSFLATSVAWCDNEIDGEDMPWGGEPPSDIETINSDSVSSRLPIYYDLSGRRVINPQSGTIYIVNGKKIIKK